MAELDRRARLSLEACTRCGRCQDVCPAFASGKALTPKQVILDLRRWLEDAQLTLAAQTGARRAMVPPRRPSPPTSASGPSSIAHDVIWSCTTCGACAQVCPVSIEHAPLLVELRRYLVMIEGAIPSEGQLALRNIETNYNPWGIGWADRAAWSAAGEGQWRRATRDRPCDTRRRGVMSETWLYWVGCAGAFDQRNQLVARAFTALLDQAGVPFVTLGTRERCCGDPARRLGNEFLFQSLAEENTAAILDTGAKHVVTACPHCYRVLKHEYELPDTEVLHHSELLARLIAEGRLDATASPSGVRPHGLPRLVLPGPL